MCTSRQLSPTHAPTSLSAVGANRCSGSCKRLHSALSLADVRRAICPHLFTHLLQALLKINRKLFDMVINLSILNSHLFILKIDLGILSIQFGSEQDCETINLRISDCTCTVNLRIDRINLRINLRIDRINLRIIFVLTASIFVLTASIFVLTPLTFPFTPNIRMPATPKIMARP